jgi:hypothetical protein
MRGFDAGEIARLGWRQGAVLGESLAATAAEHAPARIAPVESDWLIVTSHDCDIVNESLEKEPMIEILRAAPIPQKAPDKQQAGGRNPRKLHLVVESSGREVVLACTVHERWPIPRELLVDGVPRAYLSAKARRLTAEWLAKRYIRAAFPTAFDLRWRSKMKEWLSLLERHSEWIQGVYLRLNTLEELDPARLYRCHVIVAVPREMKGERGWPTARDAVDRAVAAFWTQFAPAIAFDGVDVLGTDEVTLADLGPYQRFDADWVSFADDTPTTPAPIDMPG